MASKDKIEALQFKGQSNRLSGQHLQSGGVAGIFGADARKLDEDIKPIVDLIFENLRKEFPELTFRIRESIRKDEIHSKLNGVDSRLGVKLFVPTASIRPDGRVTEVQDAKGQWRVILVGECKFQGKDIDNVQAGIRTKVMEERAQYVMPAGNAIERVHKNIQEMKNFLIQENHFPYVVFLQGSNFATGHLDLYWPDKTHVPIDPADSNLNRIDRVTASNYGMNINENHCRNLVVKINGKETSLQAATIYAQAHCFSAEQMYGVLWEIALTSLEVLSDQLPENAAQG